jgi:hypothetical protein
MTLERHECCLDSDEVKDGGVAVKTYQTEDGEWHWVAIRIMDLQPLAMCCHKIQQERKPS